MRRPGLLAAATLALATSLSAFGAQTSISTATSPAYLDAPAGGGRGRGKSKPGRWFGGARSRYMPHQGARECLRRRQGGNARRIRMERAGFRWDDAAGRFVG